MRKHRDAPKESDYARFMEKIDRTDGGCWTWTAAKDTFGYGRFWLLGSVRSAHRVSLFLLRGGSLDTDLFCLHSCDNPACVNPDHLSYGTQTDNMRDASAKGRTVNVSDWRGDKNPNAKLSNAESRAAALEYNAAMVNGRLPWGKCKAIAIKYGVRKDAIRRLAQRYGVPA